MRPGCPHFGLHQGACGGCKIQHLHPAAQVAVKQRVLEDNLAHLAKVRAEQILRPIEGPTWGYRYRARLSVRYVPRKGTVLVGFHERKSRYVADMTVCPVLPPAVSALLPALRELIGAMDGRDRLPQIELAMGDEVIALVLRHLEPLERGRRAAAARVRRRAWRPVVAAAQGAGHRASARRRGARCWPTRLPEFGVRDAVPAHRLHPGQPAHQPRAGVDARCAGSTRSRTSA